MTAWNLYSLRSIVHYTRQFISCTLEKNRECFKKVNRLYSIFYMLYKCIPPPPPHETFSLKCSEFYFLSRGELLTSRVTNTVLLATFACSTFLTYSCRFLISSFGFFHHSLIYCVICLFSYWFILVWARVSVDLYIIPLIPICVFFSYSTFSTCGDQSDGRH